MPSSHLIMLSILFRSIYSVPWPSRNGEIHYAELGTSFNHWVPEKGPHPDVEQRQVSLTSGYIKNPRTTGIGAGGLRDHRHVSTSVASNATQLGPLQPRQTVEDSNQAHDGIVPGFSSTKNDCWGHPAIPYDEIALPTSTDYPFPVQSDPSSVKAAPSDPPTISSQYQPNQSPLPSPTTTQASNNTFLTPSSGPSGCQTTLMGADVHPCAGLMTTHTSTTTIFTLVNCHGCTSVHVIAPMYACPMVTLTPGETMKTATTPYTWVSTTCKALTALDQLTEAGLPPTMATFSPISFATAEAGILTTAAAVAARAKSTTQLVWPASMTKDELPGIAVPDRQA